MTHARAADGHMKERARVLEWTPPGRDVVEHLAGRPQD
jgi:hypothetical protein